MISDFRKSPKCTIAEIVDSTWLPVRPPSALVYGINLKRSVWESMLINLPAMINIVMYERDLLRARVRSKTINLVSPTTKAWVPFRTDRLRLSHL